jgi:hypothetical protein
MNSRTNNPHEFGSLFFPVKISLTAFSVFIPPCTSLPQLGATSPHHVLSIARWERGTRDMLAYRITEIDSRIVVGTEEEPILICASIEVARRAIAEALSPATKFARRPAPESTPETSPASPVAKIATR